jgi:hypothetical protein
VNDSSIESRVRVAVAAALDKKATDLDVLAVGDLTSIADYFILASAGNERQAAAIADAITEKLKSELNVKPLLERPPAAGSCSTSATSSRTSSPRTSAASTASSGSGATRRT